MIGFEDINETRNTLQLIATIVILCAVVFTQLLVFLLLLPIPLVPKLLRVLDLRLSAEDFLKEQPKEIVLVNEVQGDGGRKRAAGGLSTAIVVAIILIISMTSLVITNDEPGSVMYRSGKIVGYLNMNIDATYGLEFTLPRNISADQSVLLVEEDYRYTDGSTGCQLRSVNDSKNVFSADIYQSIQRRVSTDFELVPLTVCGPVMAGSVNFDIFTPVDPPLKAYPPPEVFNDMINQERLKIAEYRSQVTVLHLYQNWIEMISTSPLDLLASVTTKRALQMKISTEVSTRNVNDTYSGGSKWPECYHWNTANVTYQPLFSVLIHQSGRKFEDASYIVTQSSLVSWAFTTIITIGSIVALKPTITHYVTKMSAYWKMKAALRWTLFAIYTAVVPLPLVVVIFGAIDAIHIGYRPEGYLREYSWVLLAVTSMLLLTWVGMCIRLITFELTQRRLASRGFLELSNNESVLSESPNYGTISE
jgi:hypothetical protein